MIMPSRRFFILGGLVAAPAVIAIDKLMPVRSYVTPVRSYVTMGYKGSSTFEIGLFYCPYIPLQMVRAVDQSSFQPKNGFKTRYGIVANPDKIWMKS